MSSACSTITPLVLEHTFDSLIFSGKNLLRILQLEEIITIYIFSVHQSLVIAEWKGKNDSLTDTSTHELEWEFNLR